jgi:hypothetical protein
MLVLLVLFALSAWAQTTTLTAPWLLVYDPEGRPRWEIRMERLVRTKDGWEGENVSVTLFFKGNPVFSVQAQRLSADPLGRKWSLWGDLRGEGYEFSFSAERAFWQDRLILGEFAAEGKDFRVRAREARWELSGTLELIEAQAQGSGWTLSFPYGKYAEKVLWAQEVEASGHGVSLRADFLEFHTEEGRAKFQKVKLVRSS